MKLTIALLHGIEETKLFRGSMATFLVVCLLAAAYTLTIEDYGGTIVALVFVGFCALGVLVSSPKSHDSS